MEWPVFFKYRTKIKHLTLNWPCVELALHHPTHPRHFWFDRQFFVSSWIIRLLAVHRASRSIVEPCPRLQFPIFPSNIEYRTLWTFQHACRRTIGVNQKDFLFRTYLNPPNTTLRHATNSIARIGEPSSLLWYHNWRWATRSNPIWALRRCSSQDGWKFPAILYRRNQESSW